MELFNTLKPVRVHDDRNFADRGTFYFQKPEQFRMGLIPLLCELKENFSIKFIAQIPYNYAMLK